MLNHPQVSIAMMLLEQYLAIDRDDDHTRAIATMLMNSQCFAPMAAKKSSQALTKNLTINLLIHFQILKARLP